MAVPGRGEQKNGKNKVKTATEDEGISQLVRNVVKKCLKVEPAERPDIDELIEMVESVVAQLPPDDDHGED